MSVPATPISSFTERSGETLPARMREIVALHCHPRDGAPYWIERASRCGLGTAQSIRDRADLDRFGWMDEEALRVRPVSDFIPRAVLNGGEPILLAETSGFTGRPKSSAWTESDFEAAFIAPFEPAARAAGFPPDGLWLWLGPAGPHPIGRAARRLARRFGGRDPFSVDFDPRWYNKLAPESFARDRYMEHLLEQAVRILEREPVDILFGTPAVLERLAPRLSESRRASVRGVHYGGQALGPGRLARLTNESFPAAVHMGGYGNSLFGVCIQIPVAGIAEPVYFPHGGRLCVRVVPANITSDDAPADLPGLDPGLRGRVVMDRFDPSMMILNMLERDEAALAPGNACDPPDGFGRTGIIAPGPLCSAGARAAEGIY